MKKILTLVLTFALLSALCIPAFAAAGPVSVVGDPNAKIEPGADGATVVKDATDGEINGTVKVKAANATESTLEIIVDGDISVHGDGITVAPFNGVVTDIAVNGDVICDGRDSCAVNTYADSGEVNVTIDGDVESAYCLRINTAGTIQVDGNLTAESNPIYANNADAVIFVNGDVNGNFAFSVDNAKSVAVNGEVSGKVEVGKNMTPDSIVAIGSAAAGAVPNKYAPDVIRYLIGTDDSSEATLDDVTLSGSFVSDKTLTGIDNQKFGTTKTLTELRDLVLELKDSEKIEMTLSASGKKLASVSGMGNGITATDNGDGSFTLTIDPSSFNGGLNKLILKLVAAAGSKAPKGPVYVITALTPEGVEGVEVKNEGGRVFLCIAADKAEEWGTDVKVTQNGEEFDSANYTVVLNPNGTVSLAFASSQLLSLGAGEHVFTVTVGSVSFDLTVIVNKI